MAGMTEENIICGCCKGSKRILGIGSMPMCCPVCDGAGFVSKPEIKETVLQKSKKGTRARLTKDTAHAD